MAGFTIRLGLHTIGSDVTFHQSLLLMRGGLSSRPRGTIQHKGKAARLAQDLVNAVFYAQRNLRVVPASRRRQVSVNSGSAIFDASEEA